MKTIFATSKTIVYENENNNGNPEIIMYQHKQKKLFSGWPKSVFRLKIVFLFENIENVGKVLLGNKTYFWVPKIIFGKKTIFGLTDENTP